jgi:hypothetical protein
MASDVMIYIPSFIKIDSGFHICYGGMHIETHKHADSKVIS